MKAVRQLDDRVLELIQLYGKILDTKYQLYHFVFYKEFNILMVCEGPICYGILKM